MIEKEILGKQLILAGFRHISIGNATVFLELVRKGTANCHVQFFDASMVAGLDHLYFAAFNALKAFQTKVNLSNNLAMEILIFASGQGQIKNAVELLGIKSSSSQFVVLILAEGHLEAIKSLEYISGLVGGENCDDAIVLNDEKFSLIKKRFGITDLEIKATLRKSKKEALTSLLIERSALLFAQR